MKTLGVLVATGMFTALLATSAQAQGPAAPHGAHHPPAAAESPATPPAKTMEMCAQMMGGGMAMPMMGRGGMGMMGGMPTMGEGLPADPKERAAMMEMRGEMMKAMGEVMMKHARRMQGGTGN